MDLQWRHLALTDYFGLGGGGRGEGCNVVNEQINIRREAK
jgi:hypothetical protein